MADCATLQQIVAVFAASGIKLVLVSEVEALMEGAQRMVGERTNARSPRYAPPSDSAAAQPGNPGAHRSTGTAEAQ
jgi:hypothetical protein